MNKNLLVFAALVLILSAVLIVGFVSQADQANRKETVKQLVLDAANFISVNGENAFSEFRQPETRWFQGDTYVFVWNTDGLRLVYPPDRNGEGQNMSALTDVSGKPIGKLFIDTALGETGEGWVDYQWPKPGETEPSLKETYIKSVQTGDEVLLVGSGLYVQASGNALAPLQYAAVIIEAIIAVVGLFIAVRQRKIFGYGIFLTFAVYVFYDLARLVSNEISDTLLYPAFFVATLSMLWVTILIYRENRQASPKSG